MFIKMRLIINCRLSSKINILVNSQFVKNTKDNELKITVNFELSNKIKIENFKIISIPDLEYNFGSVDFMIFRFIDKFQ
jgi:hypothetical protein